MKYQCYRCGKQGMEYQEAEGHALFNLNCAALRAKEIDDEDWDTEETEEEEE